MPRSMSVAGDQKDYSEDPKMKRILPFLVHLQKSRFRLRQHLEKPWLKQTDKRANRMVRGIGGLPLKLSDWLGHSQSSTRTG